MRVVFVFLDGVGVGSAGDFNPFWQAPMPTLRSLLGGPMVKGVTVEKGGLVFRALDATMGVPGIPQSATGQTALFTGVNAARLLGHHSPAYPNGTLIRVLNERNILKRALEMGLRATFANAYTPVYFRLVEEGKRRHSATTLSVLAAGLPLRTLEDLARGRAVYWDITHRYLRERIGIPMPLIEPELAGKRLVHLAREHHLVLFETFLTDLAGHRKDMTLALEVLDTLDRFLAGVLEAMNARITLVLSSDHGNLEDLSVGTHTANPVPLLAVGPGASVFAQARSITDVAQGVMDALQV